MSYGIQHIKVNVIWNTTYLGQCHMEYNISRSMSCGIQYINVIWNTIHQGQCHVEYNISRSMSCGIQHINVNLMWNTIH